MHARLKRLVLGVAVAGLTFAWTESASAWRTTVVTTRPPAPGAGPRDRGEQGANAMGDQRTHHATGHTEVRTHGATTFDQVEGGPSLVEIRLTETFTGDIQGEGRVRGIQAARQDGLATFVGIERVRGAIGDRKGSFLLQVSSTQLGKAVKAEWSVVPGSATGELKGLRGNGGFQAQLGEHGTIWLDYAFE